MNQNAPRGCAARGDEVYAGHTARARKCATSAHFISYEISDCENNVTAVVFRDATDGTGFRDEHGFRQNH